MPKPLFSTQNTLKLGWPIVTTLTRNAFPTFDCARVSKTAFLSLRFHFLRKIGILDRLLVDFGLLLGTLGDHFGDHFGICSAKRAFFEALFSDICSDSEK